MSLFLRVCTRLRSCRMCVTCSSWTGSFPDRRVNPRETGERRVGVLFVHVCMCLRSCRMCVTCFCLTGSFPDRYCGATSGRSSPWPRIGRAGHLRYYSSGGAARSHQNEGNRRELVPRAETWAELWKRENGRWVSANHIYIYIYILIHFIYE